MAVPPYKEFLIAKLHDYMLQRSKGDGSLCCAMAVSEEPMFVIYILSKIRSLKLDRQT